MKFNEVTSTKSPQKVGRVEWVDALKFLGIFAIYLGHFGEPAGLFYSFVFTYHVPLFFFVGGFFPYKDEQSYLQYVKKKFFAILIPYYIFHAIEMLIVFVYGNYGISSINGYLWEWLLGRRNHVGPNWFLPCFFVVAILHRGLMGIFKNKYVVLVVCYMFYTFRSILYGVFRIEPLSLIYSLDEAIYYSVYFAIGYCIFPFVKKWVEGNPFYGGKWSALKIIFCSISTVVAAIIYFTQHYYIVGKFGMTGHWFDFGVLIQTMLLIAFNILIALLLTRIPVVVLWGQHTLVFCGFESSIKMLLESVISTIGLSITLINPLATMCYTLLCLFCCYVIFEIGIKHYFPQLYKLWGK